MSNILYNDTGSVLKASAQTSTLAHRTANDILNYLNDNPVNNSSLSVNYSVYFNDNVTYNDSSNNSFTMSYDTLYPSGYSLTHIVIASIFVIILMIIVIVGNMLVIIAIMTEKSLKNIQNWFIASLAVADFSIGLVIMPFSLANELMGYWIFGSLWCDIHSAMDVLLCTASIINLCLISLDRYWSITQAIEYLKKRTPGRAMVMITLVWILSAVICIPPLLGWKVKRPANQLYPKCELSKDLGYVVYSALGSFYIPSCIMVFVYIRIYYAAKARARRGIRKTGQKSGGGIPMVKTSQKGSSGTTSPLSPSVKQVPVICSSDKGASSPLAIVLENKPQAIPIVTCDFASDISTSDAGLDGKIVVQPPGVSNVGLVSCGSADPGGGCDLEPEVKVIKDTLKVGGVKCGASSAGNFKSSTLSINNGEIQTISVQSRNRALSVGIDNDMISEFEPSSSDSGVIHKCTTKIKPLRFKFYKPIFNHINKKSSKQKREIIDIGNKIGESSQIQVVRQGSRDPEREKRRIARKKEKRATLILGLIMGSFIACWFPFFFLYILTPICNVCRDTIPDKAFAVAFWLGYMNSALNPVIYTIFNKDFRRAFRRILFK
uniref:Tyramine/octopamine receptor n=1 Tax=Cacopsylla melanoneura TaxID=428564 RepID=A0A8D9ASA1_9HEMI